MKLAFPDFTNSIVIEDGETFELIIENQRLFYSFVSDIAIQMQKQDGKSVLSNDGKPISFFSNIEFISDYAYFDLNQKTLVTKILSSLEKRATEDNFFYKQQELLSKLEAFIGELVLDCGCDLEVTSLNMASILKAAGFRIVDDYSSLEEKIVAYMELIDEYVGNRLYVFVNLKSFLPDNALLCLIEDCISHGRKVLLIDNRGVVLKSENKHLIIDCDLCEIE